MSGTPSKLEVEGIDKYNAHAKTLSENRAKTIRKSNSSEYVPISFLLIVKKRWVPLEER